MSKPEIRPFTGFWFKTDLSVQLCDDILTDGKSQSCARDEAIEFDKTFKDIFLHFRLYPGSCVFYIKFHFFFPYFISDGDISLKSEFYGIGYEIYQY